MKSLLTATVLLAATPAHACEVAQVLFGDVALDIVRYPDYETAIVRHANFNDKKLNHGAIKGEITVERGAFAVRNTNNEVVGIIDPKLVIEGEGCAEQTKLTIQRGPKDAYTIMNGTKPAGTIQGRFPKNTFGVK